MSARAETRRERRARFHGRRCAKGSPMERLVAAFDWLRVEITDTDQEIAREATASAAAHLRQLAEDLNARRGVRR